MAEPGVIQGEAEFPPGAWETEELRTMAAARVPVAVDRPFLHSSLLSLEPFWWLKILKLPRDLVVSSLLTTPTCWIY